MRRRAALDRAAVVICSLFLLSRCGPERPRPEHAVLGAKLTLRGFQEVKDFDVFTANLADDSGSFSSGYRTRNVLFVESSGATRWLLADNDHAVMEYRVSGPVASRFEEPPIVAVVALATPIDKDVKVGDLYLYDPPGRQVKLIAEGVRAVQGAALTSGGIAILYERPTGYVLAHYDAKALTRIREVDVAVPEIKLGGPTKR